MDIKFRDSFENNGSITCITRDKMKKLIIATIVQLIAIKVIIVNSMCDGEKFYV